MKLNQIFLERNLIIRINEDELSKGYLHIYENKLENRLDRCSINTGRNQFKSDEDKINERKSIVLLEKYIQKIRPIIEKKYKQEPCSVECKKIQKVLINWVSKASNKRAMFLSALCNSKKSRFTEEQ